MSESHAVEVLLVEDNPTDAELTLRALRGKGLRNSLVVVEDGAQALDFLFARGKWSHRDIASGPKMVLLDLRLPKVDGIEVLREVKSDERTRQIPVVILTSSRQDPDIQRCYELGANSYIVKPVDFDKFAVCVAEVGLYWLLLNEPPR
ncbi:MAG: response regulator [Longimicrobiales bacterium]|nr:response regulator [Longimicrobiales bacterium]